MNRVTPLLKTPLVTLVQFDHPPDEVHHDPPGEIAPAFSISFVDCGSFELRVEKKRWRLSPRGIFLTHPGLVYRCLHSEEMPADVCFSILYSRSFADEAGGKFATRTPVLPGSNRLAYLRLCFARLAESKDPLAAESVAGELWAAIAADNGKPAKHYGDRQLHWYFKRIEAARALLETDSAEPHSLASLGRAVGMSPYHFARLFRELTGAPPHRYLLNIRLARAAERLRAGDSVTGACFATGFGNLSHFSRLFHRRFGVPPSLFPQKNLPRA